MEKSNKDVAQDFKNEKEKSSQNILKDYEIYEKKSDKIINKNKKKNNNLEYKKSPERKYSPLKN